MIMLFTILSAILLVISSADKRRRILTTGWDNDASSEEYNIDYVKAYIKCQYGMINMWFGEAKSLPFGWKICDGKDDKTPDLRNKFVVGAGGEYDYGECGGKKEIELTVKQLPSHKHKISALAVSQNGWHTHATKKGKTEKNGWHNHNAGKLKTEKHLGHKHYFDGTTMKDGGHKHLKHNFTTMAENDHNHSIKWAQAHWEKETHTHGHNLSVNKEGSNHTHWIKLNMDPLPPHTHWLNRDKTEVKIDIPDHTHDAGWYRINDHIDSHNHIVRGRITGGEHKHGINVRFNGGMHWHKIDELVTSDSPDHYHGYGTLKTKMDGNHSHVIPKHNTSSNQHDHDIKAYAHSSWMDSYKSYTPTNEEWGLAADCINKEKSWTIKVENDRHLHSIPQHWTDNDGEHRHKIEGKTALNGKHNHTVKGYTVNKTHSHWIVNDTEKGNHSHAFVNGLSDYHKITFKHKIGGYSGKNGSFSSNFNVWGITKGNTSLPSGHGRTYGNDGNHTHGLDGFIKPNRGKHRHNVTGHTEAGTAHKHRINGYCGGDRDGIHNHSFEGDTGIAGMHKHDVTGTTDYSAAHSHEILVLNITSNGTHNHTVSGMTEEEGYGEPIDIRPPFFSVWYICCTLENSPSFTWSADDDDYHDNTYDADNKNGGYSTDPYVAVNDNTYDTTKKPDNNDYDGYQEKQTTQDPYVAANDGYKQEGAEYVDDKTAEY